MDCGTTGLRRTFLMIGAYKADTISPHHYLRQHPQVFISRSKEIRFLTYAGHHKSLREDILRTQDLIGRDLTHWLEQACHP